MHTVALRPSVWRILPQPRVQISWQSSPGALLQPTGRYRAALLAQTSPLDPSSVLRPRARLDRPPARASPQVERRLAAEPGECRERARRPAAAGADHRLRSYELGEGAAALPRAIPTMTTCARSTWCRRPTFGPPCRTISASIRPRRGAAALVQAM